MCPLSHTHTNSVLTFASNGIDTDLIGVEKTEPDLPQYETYRVRRTRLQSALIAQVPKGVIQLNKCLARIEDLEGGGAHLSFTDGTEKTVDLLIGADGIRSVNFPSEEYQEMLTD